MTKRFKDALNEHYKTKKISTEKVKELQLLASGSSVFIERWKFFAVPALLVIIVLKQTIFLPLHEKIANEVRFNHLKNMKSEILTQRFDDVGLFLSKLDFSVVKSRMLKADLILVGARYCSIQGRIAAQLKLIHSKTHKRYTLYEFLSKKELLSFDERAEILDDEVLIKIWKEGDIGFALAEDIKVEK